METITQVIKTVAETTGNLVEDVTESSDLRIDLNLSELEIRDTIAALEEEFDIDLSHTDIELVNTVHDLATEVEDKL
ncbi:acyl carrier protein [Candidatus Curtissbacteria bacterium]|nr:acyl carrier protein [Candidatus Curtissbacteria bacterium]